jgi:Fe-S-cluster containining protein
MHAIIRVLFQCEHCGACCKISRAYSQTDVDRIEAYTGEPRELIEQKLESFKCGYLVDNLCSIHFAKPSVCKWWPGPGTESCPAYAKAWDKYCKPGSMSKICNTPELSELYIKCVLHNDVEAAKAILRKLDIEE